MLFFNKKSQTFFSIRRSFGTKGYIHTFCIFEDKLKTLFSILGNALKNGKF